MQDFAIALFSHRPGNSDGCEEDGYILDQILTGYGGGKGKLMPADIGKDEKSDDGAGQSYQKHKYGSTGQRSYQQTKADG